MESLARIADRLTKQIRTLPARGRFAVLLCGLAILFGIVVFANRTTSQTKEPLFDGQTFSFGELAEMMAAFGDAGLLDAETVGNQIHAPRAELDRYLVALKATDAMPLAIDDSVDQAVASSSLFPSFSETERVHLHAEEQKLARIVAHMHGIETASVQYDEVKKPGFPPTVEARAFVAVRAIGGRPLDYEQIEAIRDTVAGYFGGLERADVTVTDLVACRAYPGSYDASDPLAAGRAFATLKRLLEDEYRANIQSQLEMYPGAVVGVDVHLSAPAEASTQPGAPARGSPMAPSLVRASISLPQSLFEDLWRRRYRQPMGAVPTLGELQECEREVQTSVEQTVVAMRPPPASHMRTAEQVTVTSHWDAPALAAESDATWTFGTWLGGHRLAAILGTLLIVGAGLGLVYRYRDSLSDAPSADNATASETGPEMTTDPTATVSDEMDSAVLDVQEAIARIVRQNPESAAELIRNWLGKAA